MLPDLFTIATPQGGVPIHTWGLMITLAFLASAWVVQGRAREGGVDGDKLVGLYLVAFLCGLAGARLLHFTMAEPERFFANPLVYFRIWEGGFAFYGGVILAVLGCVIYALARGIPVWKLADLTAPAIMIGLAIGRLGCFMAGCCHGAACDLPPGAVNLLPDAFSGGALWAFASPPFLATEPYGGVGTNHQPLLPTQLWSSALALALFFLLSWRWRRRRYDGQVFAWLLLVYPLTRSTIEALRGDLVRGVDWFGVLTTSQLISIPVFLAGVVIVVLRRRGGVAEVKQADHEQELLDELLRGD
jgi:phosphatidylglycerol:prolipoprotein diacylglycerol transferase